MSPAACNADLVTTYWKNTKEWGTRESASAEELAEPVLLFSAPAVGIAVAIRFMIAVSRVFVPSSIAWLRRRGLSHRAFDNFVELTAVKPYPATFRAVVNFHPAPVRHDEF